MRRVGIDLALRAPHRATVFDDAVQVGRPFKVRPTREGIDELVRRTTTGTDGPCEFILEPTGLAFLPIAAELSPIVGRCCKDGVAALSDSPSAAPIS